MSKAKTKEESAPTAGETDGPTLLSRIDSISARLFALEQEPLATTRVLDEHAALARLEALEEALIEATHTLVFFLEYAIWNEGRDRFAGPKPSGKLAELGRMRDGMRKRMANGFTTNDRPNLAGVDQSDQGAVQPVRNGDPA